MLRAGVTSLVLKRPALDRLDERVSVNRVLSISQGLSRNVFEPTLEVLPCPCL